MRANCGLPEVSKLEFTESFFRMQYVSRETNAKVAMKGGFPRGTQIQSHSIFAGRRQG